MFGLVYPGLQTDSQIAKNAVKTVQAAAHGDVVSTVVLSTADLPIDYIVQGGKFKSRRWAFVFGEFHHEKPLQVFYLKGQPEIGTTNWAIDALPLRWGTFWAFAIIFAFGVLLVWALTAVAIHHAKSLRRTASKPAAIEAAILSGNQRKEQPVLELLLGVTKRENPEESGCLVTEQKTVLHDASGGPRIGHRMRERSGPPG